MLFMRIKMIIFLALGAWACNPPQQTTEEATTAERPPNVVLIMADDMGYECLSAYGSTSYQTPVLDSLAANGVLFSQCVSQPLCTPSRVKIMTGMYNFRNYDYFGHLQSDAYTFGHLMQDAGYATCIAGKWQLNGLAYKDEIPYWNDQNRPHQLGFDDYCLWQLTHTRAEGERYADALLEQNGEVLDTKGQYGPDIFADFILDFIEKQQDQPFFVYYPMVLVHDPFVPTPDSEAWSDPARRYEDDTTYFRDMVSYTDKIVGRIADKLHELELDENTILIFTGDNGTHRSIVSHTQQRTVEGGKGKTIDAGTHVPLIAYWPDQIREGQVFDGLIEFSDFFPTLAEATGQQVEKDGQSFYSLLTGDDYQTRETAFVYYDPRWGNFVNQYRNKFIRTLDYKLYQDGKFYYLPSDLEETQPLDEPDLSPEAKQTRNQLRSVLEQYPDIE